MQQVHHNWYFHKNLQNIQTKLPSYEEQTKIAKFLSELDKLIEKQSDKVELLKDRKKDYYKNVRLILIKPIM